MSVGDGLTYLSTLLSTLVKRFVRQEVALILMRPITQVQPSPFL